MAKYTANIVAKVDFGGIENLKKELNNIENNERIINFTAGAGLSAIERRIRALSSTPITLNFNSNGITTAVNNISRQFTNVGQQAGNSISQSISNGVRRVDLSDLRTETQDFARQVERSLSSINIGGNGDDINKNIRQALATTELDIDRIRTSLNRITGDIDVTITGRDSIGQTVDAMVTLVNTGNELTPILTRVVNTQNDVSGAISAARASVEANNEAFKQYKNTISQINSIELKIRGLDENTNSNELQEYTRQLETLRERLVELSRQASGTLTLPQQNQIQSETTETINKINLLEAKLRDARVNAENAITLKINDDNWASTFSGLKGDITELKAKGSESVSALSDELKQLKATRDSLKDKSGDELISGFEKYEEQLQSLQAHIKTAKNELKGLASAASISRTSSSFETWLSKNTKALDHYGDEIDKVRQKLMEFKDVGATTAELNSVKTAIDNIKSTAAAEGNVGVSWIGKLGDQFKKLSTYVSAASVIYTGIRALKDIVSNVTSIDSALVELKKVTSETDATYSQFLDNAKSKAVELGTSITDIVNSTADFARLGYSITDATTLAENASIFLRVADNMDSIDTATSVLVSTMKAYNIEASDSMSIIDRLNSVSNNYAVTTGGLGEALSRSASSFAASRNSLDESLALITAANEIVQDDAATGTAFKTNFCLYVQKCA